MENLIELQTGILLNKFGAGNHKPGSGSAVALQGMLAAQMIRTVIDLTKSKYAYKSIHKELDEIVNEVEKIIYPALAELIQKDSIEFGKAIEARKARNAERNIEKKCELAKQALISLKSATEIPVEVAKNCIRLAEIGLYVFDNCFKSARGDSSVSINGALSAVSGCLAIINLNLLSFESNDWTDRMRIEADNIKRTRDSLALQEDDRQGELQIEAEKLHQFNVEFDSIVKRIQATERVSYEHIEKLASEIQNTIWRHRNVLWKNNIPKFPIEIIDPKKILKKIGYQYLECEALTNFEQSLMGIEVAGIIDTRKKHVSIATGFSPETINFTIAHELGHAILHPNLVLHRDRPMDGSTVNRIVDYKERQANIFAACFLMPQKLIRQKLLERFYCSKLEINTQVAIGLGLKLTELRKLCKSNYDFARIIAIAESFNASAFHSLSDEFQVSHETMAIRLVELELISIQGQ